MYCEKTDLDKWFVDECVGQMHLMEDAEDDPEQVSKVEKILQDLANGVVDETLPRLMEKDIAFDMDGL